MEAVMITAIITGGVFGCVLAFVVLGVRTDVDVLMHKLEMKKLEHAVERERAERREREVALLVSSNSDSDREHT